MGKSSGVLSELNVCMKHWVQLLNIRQKHVDTCVCLYMCVCAFTDPHDGEHGGKIRRNSFKSPGSRSCPQTQVSRISLAFLNPNLSHRRKITGLRLPVSASLLDIKKWICLSIGQVHFGQLCFRNVCSRFTLRKHIPGCLTRVIAPLSSRFPVDPGSVLRSRPNHTETHYSIVGYLVIFFYFFYHILSYCIVFLT